jgi:hypothetical protein
LPVTETTCALAVGARYTELGVAATDSDAAGAETLTEGTNTEGPMKLWANESESGQNRGGEVRDMAI